MAKLAQTTAGKTLKVAAWSGVSAVLAVVIAGIADWNLPADIVWLLPVVNTVLVALKNLVDSKVPNLPK